jgi:hypothetical protein
VVVSRIRCDLRFALVSRAMVFASAAGARFFSG